MPINSLEYAAVISGDPSRRLDPAQKHSRLVTALATVQTGTGIPVGDFANLFPIPDGSRIIDGRVFGDINAGTVIDIGVAGGTANFVAGQSVTSAASYDFVQVAANFGAEVIGNQVARLTVSGTAYAANKTIRVSCIYAAP